jgi:four helix bundle protein
MEGYKIMKNFRTYHLAVEFYKLAIILPLPGHLSNQLDRAASSVALNLAEGYARFGKKDQKRFYKIAFASLRECQAIVELRGGADEYVQKKADILAAHLYRLIKS